jgi:hypothetical protein
MALFTPFSYMKQRVVEAAPAFPIITSGLTVYLNAGDTDSYPGSGTTWTDLVSGYNATLINTPTFSSSNGGYFDFNPAQAEYATMYTMPGTFWTGSWTVQMWVYQDNVAERAFLSQGTTANNQGLHLITRLQNGANRYLLGMFNNDYISGTSAVTATWRLVTFTYNSSSPYTKQLYINTTLDTPYSSVTNAYAGTNNNTELARIGWGGFNGYYYDGRMAQVWIYNRVLSSTEVTDNFNATKATYGL